MNTDDKHAWPQTYFLSSIVADAQRPSKNSDFLRWIGNYTFRWTGPFSTVLQIDRLAALFAEACFLAPLCGSEVPSNRSVPDASLRQSRWTGTRRKPQESQTQRSSAGSARIARTASSRHIEVVPLAFLQPGSW